MLVAVIMKGQQEHAELEKQVRSSGGIEQVRRSNQLAAQYLSDSPSKTLAQASQSLNYLKALEDELKEARKNPAEFENIELPQEAQLLRAEAVSRNLLGRAYRKLNNRRKAIDQFRRGYRLSKRAGYREGESLASTQLRELDAGLGIGALIDESLESTGVKKSVKDMSSELKVSHLENQARNQEEKGRYEMAIETYSKTIRFYKSDDDSLKLAEVYARIAALQNELGETEKALVYYDLSDKMQGKREDVKAAVSGLDSSMRELENMRLALEAEVLADSAAQELFPDSKWLAAELPEVPPDFEQSAEFQESYERLREQLTRIKENRQTDSLVRAILIQEQRDKIANLQRDREVQLLKVEQAEAEMQRRDAIQYALIAGLLFILILAGVLTALFIIKRNSHKRLAQAFNRLDMAHEQLKATQLQLVEAEKMASLGQLTAGIAHEINNPLNFISGNISPLKRDIHDLIKVIDAYEEVGENTDQLKLADKIREELEIEFVREEIEFLLQGMQEGASRTAEIVQGLRDFSRLDEDMPKPFDVNESLRHTLALLRPAYEGRIEIAQRYDSDLPEITGLAGKVNQVFLNVLNNAIESIKGEGKIIIETHALGDSIQVSIRDTGTGMASEVMQKAFDPFFTTKDVGEGKGLGLAISHGIIQRHQGTIRLESEPGSGTLVEIELPVSPDMGELLAESNQAPA